MLSKRLKRLVLPILAFAMSASFALGMTQGSIPTNIPTVWGTSAPGANITCPPPTPSQIGVTAGRASYTDGFPPLTFQSPGSGGIPPSGADFNGVLCHYSQWLRWHQAGAPVPYNATFQSGIGGYPNGAVVASSTTSALWWMSTTDNNASNPDTGGANWSGVGMVPTGSMIAFGGSSAPPGYLLAQGQAVSRTTYAALFAVIGTTYGSGDGSTTFNVPDLRGRAPFGVDAGANRITNAGSGCTATLGTGCGAQNQTLTQAQLPAIAATFTGSSSSVSFGSPFSSGVATAAAASGANFLAYDEAGTSPSATVTPLGNVTWPGPQSNLGSGSSHPVLSPAEIVNWIIKY